MQLPTHIADDFKTTRKDITPPLQNALRIIPLLFYCSVIGAVVLGLIFFVQLRLATEKLAASERELASISAQLGEVKAQRTALETRILRARDIESWVSASRPLQPLAVAIARSVQEGATIEELRLDRTDQTGPEVRMNLRLGSGSMDQLDRTITAIETEKYRLFSPQQEVTPGEINYKTSLVWQDAAGQAPPPSETPQMR